MAMPDDPDPDEPVPYYLTPMGEAVPPPDEP